MNRLVRLDGAGEIEEEITVGKGILLEREGRLGIVLTPQGEFRRVPLPQGTLEIGAELEFAEPRPMPWMGWQVAAAAAALLIVLSPFGYRTWAATVPVALVTVDINPSIELTLNSSDQVLDADGLNADGDAVLAGLDWKRHSVAEVVAAVTDKAIEMKKLDVASEYGAVVVAVAPAGKKELKTETADQLLAKARDAVNHEVAAKAAERSVAPRTQVVALSTNLAEKAEAESRGLTPGQYKILQEIQASQPDVQPEQIKAKGPGKLIHELGMDPQEVFSKAEEHSNEKARSGNSKQPTVPASTDPSKKGQNPGKKDDPKDKSGPSDKANGNNGKSNDKGNDKSNGKSDDKKGQGSEPDKGKSEEKGKGALSDEPGGQAMAPAPAGDNPVASSGSGAGNVADNAETHQPGNAPASGVAAPTGGQAPGGNGQSDQAANPGDDKQQGRSASGSDGTGKDRDEGGTNGRGGQKPDQAGKDVQKGQDSHDGQASGQSGKNDQGGKPDEGAKPDQDGKTDQNGKSDHSDKPGQGGKP